MVSDKPIVFVSCGQYAAAEKKLGNDICALLQEVRPDVEPYFAEDQSTVEGLSNHILKALFRSAGFICVMHQRGDLELPEGKIITRASVWVEQEIAIAAFMNHALGHSVPIFFYKEVGIGLEGIRSVLMMNPRVEFTEESQVLADLRSVLPATVFNPFSDYDVIPVAQYNDVKIELHRHVYSFAVDVQNVGNQRVTDFQLRVFFPRIFMNQHTRWGAEDPHRSTESHMCFVADSKTRAPGGLYPGDGMKDPLPIEYFIDDKLFNNPQAMQSEIRIELYSGSMSPKKRNLPIRDFQKF